MSNINLLFRKRIGIPQNEVITFQNLDKVLEKTAKSIPFENLCIIENRTKEITIENLTIKILKQHEDGLCYERVVPHAILTSDTYKIAKDY
jgi:N-hydroxyarylamine O-acetyltransferase